MTKSDKLRYLLNSNDTEFIMEAHSGVSAVIAEDTGFKGIWASGLTMSAMTGCRDRNELDISEVCKIVEWMADHTTVPILVDGDTGGVDPNAARILVNKLTKAGAAGVCIEDKLYPKHNSFLVNSKEDLSDPYFHANKIIEMKKENPNFVVIARLESFIAGQSVDEAIRRANIYSKAGADAILVHSKRKDSSDIVAFMDKWDTSISPVVIVPTKYYTTPTDEFKDLGISIVIWANHQMRASIVSMKTLCNQVYNSQSLVPVESKIATVSDIFELQKDDELAKAEKDYYSTNRGSAIVLSAITNKNNRNGTPKCFETVSGVPLIDYIEVCLEYKVDKVYLVLGQGRVNDYTPDNYNYYVDTKVVVNSNWKESTEVDSLRSGLSHISNINTRLPLYIIYGDELFKKSIYNRISDNEFNSYDIVIGIDSKYDSTESNEYVVGSSKNTKINISGCSEITGISDTETTDTIGIFTGIIKISTAYGLLALKTVIDKAKEHIGKYKMRELLQDMIKSSHCKVVGVYVPHEDWADINGPKDFLKGEIIANERY